MAGGVVPQRCGGRLSPPRPLSPPSPLPIPLYWDVVQPSCAFHEGRMGGPVLRSSPRCLPVVSAATTTPSTPPLWSTSFPNFRTCGGSTEQPSPPQTSGLSRYCRCAAKWAHILFGFFFLFFFFFGSGLFPCSGQSRLKNAQGAPLSPVVSPFFLFFLVPFFCVSSCWPPLDAPMPGFPFRVRSRGPVAIQCPSSLIGCAHQARVSVP